MAHFDKRLNKWRHQIKRPGQEPISIVHESKREVERQVRVLVTAMDGGKCLAWGALKQTTVGDVLRWFRDHVSKHRAGDKWEVNRINAYLGERWSQMTLEHEAAVARAIGEWVQYRITGDSAKGIKPVKRQTANRDMNLLSTAFTHVGRIGEHGGGFVGCPNPIKSIQRPGMDEVRKTQVWTPDDLHAFLDHFEFDEDRAPASVTDYVPWTLLALNLTGLRPKTLFATRLDWIDIDGDAGSIRYPGLLRDKRVVKNDAQWDCPLDARACVVIAKLAAHMRAKGYDRLFPVGYGSIAKLFADHRAALSSRYPRARKLIIYGQRHTWTTMNVPLFTNVAQMLQYTGRKSIKDAMVYFQPDAKEQARMLDERRRQLEAERAAAKAPPPPAAPAAAQGAVDPAVVQAAVAAALAAIQQAQAPAEGPKLVRVA
jgi:integrase